MSNIGKGTVVRERMASKAEKMIAWKKKKKKRPKRYK
jgi:hypothetical protein